MQVRDTIELSYAHIQDRLKNYDGYKGKFRQTLGDYPHIINVKTALNEAIASAKALSHTDAIPSIPGVPDNDNINNIRANLAEIETFITFYRVLISELNKTLPGKESIIALNDIKSMIDHSSIGTFADFWMQTKMQDADDAQPALTNFFINVYLQLFIKNPTLLERRQYSAQQIKTLVQLYLQHRPSHDNANTLLRDILLDERWNEFNLGKLNAWLFAQNSRGAHEMVRYYLTHPDFENICMAWELAFSLKMRCQLDLLTPDIAQNRDALIEVTNCLSIIASHPVRSERFLIQSLQQYHSTPWLRNTSNNKLALARAIHHYLAADAFFYRHLSSINTNANQCILFIHAPILGSLEGIWTGLNRPTGRAHPADDLQRQFYLIITHLEKLSHMDLLTLNLIPAAKRGEPFFATLLQLCNDHQDVDECAHHLNNYITEVVRLNDIESVYRAFFPADVQLEQNFNRYHEQINRFLPLFLRIILTREFSWIPDQAKGSIFFNEVLDRLERNEAFPAIQAHIRHVFEDQNWYILRETIAIGIHFELPPMIFALQNQHNLPLNLDLNRANRHALDRQQSTHTASVHRSISQSAIRLRDYFEERQIPVNVDIALEDYADHLQRDLDTMENYDEHPKDSDHYQLWLETDSALTLVQKIQHPDYDFTDPQSGVTTKALLSMAWLAMNHEDLRTFPRGDNGETFISDRDDGLNKLRRALYEAERGYNFDDNDIDQGGPNHSICKPGTFNKVMEGLHTIVKCVIIILATKEYALSELKRNTINNLIDYLNAYPKTTPEERLNYLALLRTLKKDGTPEPLWEALKEKILQAFRSEFSMIYSDDLGVVSEARLEEDVTNAVIYLDISALIKDKIKVFWENHATPSTQGMFAQTNPEAAKDPANEPPLPPSLH